MFAYNPTVNDRSGEILAAYQIKAAEQDMQTKQFLGEQIGNIGTALTGVLTKAAENRIASDGVNAKFDMLKDYTKTDGSPLFTKETIDKFDTMPLGKRQGMVSTAESVMDHDLKRWMYQTQYNAQANRVNANMLAQQPAPNQQPYTGVPAAAPTAQPQANPAGNINMKFVTEPNQQQ
jgi:hypothetical protein